MSWAVTIGVGIAAVGTAYNVYEADKAQDKAQSQLDALNKQKVPTYTESPALAMANAAAVNDYFNPTGVSTTQRNVFKNNLAENNNTNVTNSVNRSGGQVGSFLQGVNNVSNTNAINNFANTDAQITQQNKQSGANRMLSIAGQEQNISDKNTQAAIQRRLLIEQALGGAVAQQQQNKSAAINNFTSTAVSAGTYKAGQMGGGGNKTDEYGTYNPEKSNGMTSDGQDTGGFRSNGLFEPMLKNPVYSPQ